MADQPRLNATVEWLKARPIVETRLWVEPDPDARTYPVGSPEVWRYWTPVLGPTASIALFLLQRDLPEGRFDQQQFAAQLGIQANGWKLMRCLARLARFHAVRPRGEFLLVRDALFLPTESVPLPDYLRAELQQRTP